MMGRRGGDSAGANMQAVLSILSAQQQAVALQTSAAAQAKHMAEQAQGANQAQQAAINQANLANKLREQEQNTQTPETKVEASPDAQVAADPRQKYRSARNKAGSTGGGVGIRLT